MNAIQDTHQKLLEDQKKMEEQETKLLSQKLELENEKNDLWLKYILQGPS